MDQNNEWDREPNETENGSPDVPSLPTETEPEYTTYRVIDGAGNAYSYGMPVPDAAKEKKKTTPVFIAVLCVLCLLVGAGAMFGILSRRGENEGKPLPTVSETAGTEAQGAKETSPAVRHETAAPTQPGSAEEETEVTPAEEEPAPSFISGTGDGAVLSAKKIYASNVHSVVGIVAEGTTRNIFGQVSKTASSGTGFILTADGYIMTNNHVVESSNSLTVTLYDGTSYPASIVGTEPDNDIAVLRIQASGLPAVTLGDSEGISVGDDVCIIGNPLGELTFTMTRGIVSALNRTIHADSTPIRMFQIDAAVNSGNSGGPAFNDRGEVIGIVTAKYASESIEGIGFCIPMSDAQAIADDLIRYGYVRGKTTLGIEVLDAREVYDYYYRYYGRRGREDIFSTLSQTGAYVNSVQSGGSAETAGIKAGDFILEWNGEALEDAAAFEAALKASKPGDTVSLTVLQNGIRNRLTVTVAELVPAGIRSAGGETRLS